MGTPRPSPMTAQTRFLAAAILLLASSGISCFAMEGNAIDEDPARRVYVSSEYATSIEREKERERERVGSAPLGESERTAVDDFDLLGEPVRLEPQSIRIRPATACECNSRIVDGEEKLYTGYEEKVDAYGGSASQTMLNKPNVETSFKYTVIKSDVEECRDLMYNGTKRPIGAQCTLRSLGGVNMELTNENANTPACIRRINQNDETWLPKSNAWNGDQCLSHLRNCAINVDVSGVDYFMATSAVLSISATMCEFPALMKTSNVMNRDATMKPESYKEYNARMKKSPNRVLVKLFYQSDGLKQGFSQKDGIGNLEGNTATAQASRCAAEKKEVKSTEGIWEQYKNEKGEDAFLCDKSESGTGDSKCRILFGEDKRFNAKRLRFQLKCVAGAIPSSAWAYRRCGKRLCVGGQNQAGFTNDQRFYALPVTKGRRRKEGAGYCSNTPGDKLVTPSNCCVGVCKTEHGGPAGDGKFLGKQWCLINKYYGGHGAIQVPGSTASHCVGFDPNSKNTKIKVEIKTQMNKFDWSPNTLSEIDGIFESSAAASQSACPALLKNTVITDAFANWTINEDGSFSESPLVAEKNETWIPINIMKPLDLTGMVMKKVLITMPESSRLEKRMLCFQGTKLATELCCVSKKLTMFNIPNVSSDAQDEDPDWKEYKGYELNARGRLKMF